MSNMQNVTSSECNKWHLTVFRVGLLSVFCFIVISLGCIGNVIAIAVLKREWRRSSMSILLSGLGIYDILFLLLSLYHVSYKAGLYNISSLYVPLSVDRVLAPLTWYLGNSARAGRNWCAVVVAIDRFVAVYCPLRSSRLSNPRRAKMYLLLISAVALLYNIPRLFEHFVEEDTANGRLRMAGREDLPPLYRLLYGSILYCTCIVIGPILLLTLFNVLLTRSILMTASVRVQLTPAQVGCRRDTQMLVILIAVYIVAELPGSIVQTITVLYYPSSCVFWAYVMGCVNVLTILNSSINCVIYCLCGMRFRRNMRRMFVRRPAHNDERHPAVGRMLYRTGRPNIHNAVPAPVVFAEANVWHDYS